MQAVILAAGQNTRFQELFDAPFIKQSLEVDQTPILIRGMHALETISCSEIVLVVGENKDLISNLIQKFYKGSLPITMIENLYPERANGYSLGLSQKVIKDWFYLLMSDHLYDKAFMDCVISVQGTSTPSLFVDYKIDQVFDLNDATKVHEEERQILEIGKDITQYNCIDTGFFYLHEDLFEAFNELEKEQESISISEIIQKYSASNPFVVTDIGSALWQDVDDMDMYRHAKKVFGKG